MAKMQEFKCPCCGGSIEFDSSVQKMKCPFCDTEYVIGICPDCGGRAA
jgi:primosomal protein N'